MFVVAAAIALVAAACGGSDNPVAGGGSAPTTAASTATTAGASAGSCQQAAGFADSAQVQDKGTKPATGTAVTVEAGDFFFGPTCTSETPAGTVMLTVHNGGQALHNVSIADQGVDEDVAAGETITVEVKVGASPVQYVCKYHRTSGMVGALLPAGS